MDNLDANKKVSFDLEDQADNKSPVCEDEDFRPHLNKFESLLTEDNDQDSNLDDENSSSKDSDIDSDMQETSAHSKIKTAKSRKRRPKKKHNKSPRKQQSHNLDTEDISKSNIPNSEPKSSSKLVSSRLHLLRLDTRKFNPEAELKRIFGKSVLKEERSKEAVSGKARHISNLQRSRLVPSHNLEAFRYTGRNFPRMELDDLVNDLHNSDGSELQKDSNSVTDNPFFRYIHDPPYQRVHANFFNAIHEGVSELIVHNFSLNPTHVETLVKLSDMMALSGNHKDASYLIERALLVLERGFNPKFSSSLGRCRLTYRRPENRTLFITVYKHINCLNRRGLRRTALEFTKFLLSLDPDGDPLFSALLVDYFCLRSEEYDYLIEFTSKWQSLNKLPNFNFSPALAYYMKSRSLKLGKATSESNLKMADELLQISLLRYPNFIVQLLDACSAEPAGVKKCDYFNYTIFGSRYRTVPESVELLVSLYVQRTCPLWKVKHVMEWLERNVAIMVGKFERSELVDEGINVEWWSGLQGPVPRNLLRHVTLSELNVTLPPSVSGITNLDIDPFPPDSILSYDVRQIRARVTNAPSSSLGLFLRSIMPSFILEPSTVDPESVQHLEESIGPEHLGELEENHWLPSSVIEAISQLLGNREPNGSNENQPERDPR